jgi:hypothetical protein
MCNVPQFTYSLPKIIDYLKDLMDWGWYVNRMYQGDLKVHYLLTRTVIELDPCVMTKCQYDITLDQKKLKNGKYIYIFNDDFYSSEDEVIEEMKRMGIK